MDKMRADFETWCRDNGINIARSIKTSDGLPSEDYRFISTRDLWDAWQAALSQEAEPVAWIDLSKMTPSGMVYATGFKANDRQTALYASPPMAAPLPQPDLYKCRNCEWQGRDLNMHEGLCSDLYMETLPQPVASVPQDDEEFYRVYNRLFSRRGADTKHMAECEEVWNAAIATKKIASVPQDEQDICQCTADETTGWTQWPVCNVCSKIVEGVELSQGAEIQRLTECLQKANIQAEHFEREWYLRGDEIEKLKSVPQDKQAINDAMATSVENRMKELHYKNLLADHDRLVRELDVLLNGELAVEQPRLLDIVTRLSLEKKSCQSAAVQNVETFIAKNQQTWWRANALADSTKHLVIESSDIRAWMAGHARVPVEPNQNMLNAARDWSYKKYDKPIGNDAAIGCWSAMLTASKESESSAASQQEGV